jgi:hypothetical protein
MIVKTFYKDNFTYVEGVNYFELCKEDNFMVLKGVNLDLTISNVDRVVLFNDRGEKLENVTLIKREK